MEFDPPSVPPFAHSEPTAVDAPIGAGASETQFENMLGAHRKNLANDEHQNHDHKPWSTLNVARELRLDGAPDDPALPVFENGIRENLRGQLNQLEQAAHTLPSDQRVQAVDDLGEQIFDATRNGVLKENDADKAMKRLQLLRVEHHSVVPQNSDDVIHDAEAWMADMGEFLNNHANRYGNDR